MRGVRKWWHRLWRHRTYAYREYCPECCPQVKALGWCLSCGVWIGLLDRPIDHLHIRYKQEEPK